MSSLGHKDLPMHNTHIMEKSKCGGELGYIKANGLF